MAATTGAEKRTALLRQITEEGGFAFVASVEKAAAGDLRAAEAAREMAWEQLHSAPRAEVGAAWRDAYALACLQVAALRGGDDRRAALRELDMGLIMGGGLLRAELEDAIARVVADRRGGGDEEPVAGGNVERWKEGIAGDRDLADVTTQTSTGEIPIFGCIDHWPARTKWKDIKYLERVAGDRTIPVEVGKSYACTEWKQELITFSQFLERMWSSDSANLAYLVRHPLFDQVIACVDLDNIDEKEFPKTADLEFMDGILEEGDLLYIPPKWWHYMSYGADYLFYLAVDLTFVIINDKALTANRTVHNKHSKTLLRGISDSPLDLDAMYIHM
ncbi:hypothetical protein BAE44_0014558 [Dichanthelium oligosanthes]|uniref:Uncharacterized protein n=1 Tax=Dichanthelium oligosanthes TaxID=888268 RepID=A0A1E5VH14_9POAL|nr:hypothetical protein BAE44_0014558 [Dichanthelium oligosanthes]